MSLVYLSMTLIVNRFFVDVLGWLKSSFWQENTNELSAYPVFSCFQKWETKAFKKKRSYLDTTLNFFPE